MQQLVLLILVVLMTACASDEPSQVDISEELTTEPEIQDGAESVVETAVPETVMPETVMTETAMTESGTAETVPDTDPALRLDKNRIVSRMEKRMRQLLGKSVSRFEDIQGRFAAELEALAVPPKIQAVEKELIDYYEAEEEAYEVVVERITEKYGREIDKVLAFLEPQVWEIAFELTGTEDVGASYGSHTGIDEVDEVADATLQLINFRSGRSTLADEGSHAASRRILMDRVYKNDVEGEGRLSLYVSDPMHHHFRIDEDAIAVTITYQRKGLEAGLPLEIRQAVRHRVVRGGTPQYTSKFDWDRTLGTKGGVLRLEKGGGTADIVVSTVFYPRINMDHEKFDSMKDYTAIRDYKTAVVEKGTGRILDCVSWQYTWHISHFGAVSGEKGAPPVRDGTASVIERLLKID